MDGLVEIGYGYTGGGVGWSLLANKQRPRIWGNKMWVPELDGTLGFFEERGDDLTLSFGGGRGGRAELIYAV